MPLEYTHRPVSVADKSAVVIGGTSGIGRAIALGFAEEGADVLASSRTPEKVERTAEELRERGARTRAVTCDVTDADSIARLRDAALDAFGGVDVLVNSSGAVARKGLADVDDGEWEDVMAVQLDGVATAVRVFAEAMDTGAIVNVSSEAARSAIPDLAAYSAAKGGIDAVTRAAAWEFGPDVRVNAIRPGFIATEQTEGAYAEGNHRHEVIRSRTTNGRLGRPGEVVGAAVYLASDAASYTNGEVLAVDDGFNMAAFSQ